MYHILVLDDEPISADALAELIQARLQDVQVRVAYHAAKALEMIADAPCDLIVSDIQMPGMTGLEMAGKLREARPEIRVIFLTGYDDFAYAYEAFQQNAAQYLLKTEGDERILAELERALQKIAQDRAIDDRIREAEQQYARMIPLYRKQILNNLILSPGSYSETQLREMGLFDEHVFMVVAHCVEGDAGAAAKDKFIALMAGEEIFRNALMREDCLAESFFIEADFVWLLTMRAEGDLSDILFQIARKVRKQVEERFGLRLFFVVARRAVASDALGGMFEEIKRMLLQKVAHGMTGVAIERGDARTPPVMDDGRIKEMEALRRQLELCARDARDGAIVWILEHAQPILSYLDSPPRGAESFASECALTLLGMLLSLINKNRFPIGAPVGLRLIQPDGQFADDAPARIRELLARINEKSSETMESALVATSRYVIAYVREHIAENITIQALADATGYSIGYLSRVFRLQEGISIHDYITMTKINLAKELLCNTSLRVYEIAESCGYDNPTYFIKVFRKQIGMTPQEFKQAYGQRGRK